MFWMVSIGVIVVAFGFLAAADVNVRESHLFDFGWR
jgi:hypothetical protein